MPYKTITSEKQFQEYKQRRESLAAYKHAYSFSHASEVRQLNRLIYEWLNRKEEPAPMIKKPNQENT